MKQAIMKIQSLNVPTLNLKFLTAAGVFACGALAAQITLAISGNAAASLKVFLSGAALALLTLSALYLLPVVKKAVKRLAKLPAPELRMELLVPLTIATALALAIQLALPLFFL